ncbi:T9SS type A sorting domain-containing protein [Paraflavisolibacter sp. H34]|uniref:T9SS type A sorting domain-containing protein n=1 Tax=Huijunlia imazamoxiresistens TaxID=3127457 RepID=UPI00301B46AB
MKNTTFIALCILLLFSFGASAQTTDSIPPRVLSITRQNPTNDTAYGTSVTYRVVFSEKVTGVDGSDFTATGLNGNVRGTLALLALEPVGTEGTESVQPVGTSGTTYDVSVRAIAGTGALRLDLHATGTGIKDAAGNALAAGYTGGQTYILQKIPTSGLPSSPGGDPNTGSGFTSFNDIAPLPIASHTGQKPQSKVWSYAGKWWTVLSTYEGTKVYRLDGASWTEIIRVASSKNAKADVQVVGSVVHMLLFRGGSSNSYLVSLEYDPVTGKYKLWSKRSQNMTIVFEEDTETATMTLDGNGRMWIASDGTSEINMRWSDSPYTTWSAPVVIATGIGTDDICAVTTLPGKIGVMWSNQLTQRFGFRTHTNGTDPALWTVDELPAAQSALAKKGGMADDHMNLLPASDGTLYCAVKTSYDSPGYPKVSLLVRRPNGVWDNLYPVTANEGTRPIVLLNEAQGKIKVVFSSLENGGDVLYRESALSPISFGPPITLMAGNYLINYCTSTHQAYSSDIVVLATSMEDTLQAVSVRGVDGSGTTGAAANGALTETSTESPAALSAGSGALVASPNPLSTSTTLSYTFAAASTYTVSLYDSKGQKLRVLKWGQAPAGRQTLCTVDGTGLPAGMYLVRIDTNDGSQTLKLLVRK